MNAITRRCYLSLTSVLITTFLYGQVFNAPVVPFRKLATGNTGDNHTIKEIKKKELQIIPFKVILPAPYRTTTASQDTLRKRK